MKALLCLDLINEIMDPSGKFAGHGYPVFSESHNSLAEVAKIQSRFREAGCQVIHVKVGFTPGYLECPSRSPLLGGAKAAGALALGAWSTEFCSKVAPRPGELVVVKHRVGAFHATPLDLILSTLQVEELFICGVSTDLAVNSTARAAHDLDYVVTVIANCCVAANDQDHNAALMALRKIAKVVDSNDVKI
jgi:nicotinamidase-related amidase